MQTDITQLNQVEIFHGLTAIQIERIASISQERRYRIGEIVFYENSAGDEMYVVLKGWVKIEVSQVMITQAVASKPGEMITVATLGPGQIFGEVALVDRGLRSARARCATDGTRLLIVPRDQLMTLCHAFPDLGFRLMHNLAADLAEKLRKTDLSMRGNLF
jgi:CRP-like cAMP-binding protein